MHFPYAVIEELRIYKRVIHFSLKPVEDFEVKSSLFLQLNKSSNAILHKLKI